MIAPTCSFAGLGRLSKGDRRQVRTESAAPNQKTALADPSGYWCCWFWDRRLVVRVLFGLAVVAGVSLTAVAQEFPGKPTGTIKVPAETTKQSVPYDPLKVSGGALKTLLLDVDDGKRNRTVPIKVYLPENEAPVPVVLYSHGLGGSRETSRFLGEHWAARGYVAVFIQHPGSDESVWQGRPLRERMQALREAANGENLLLRCADVPVVLDQLQRWNDDPQHPLSKRCDLDRIGMSGHSFGAATTQGVAGQQVFGEARYTDRRIKAAVIFSPSAPRVGQTDDAFGAVSLPWLLMTGTNDTAPIGDVTVENRLSVFPALPADGQKYELVLHGAEHSAFTDRPLPGERANRNPNHHRSIKALSTAFWDAYLKGDSAAKQFLHDEKMVRTVLESDDKWRRK